MFKKFFTNIWKGSNPAILFNALLAHAILLGAVSFILKPHMEKQVCVVCGRANTSPVSTLWQYKTRPIPRVAEKTVFYCPRHIEDAPDFIYELPSERDTVRQRFAIEAVLLTISLFLFVYTLVTLDLPLNAVFLQPIGMAAVFLVFGIVSNVSMTISFILLIAIPALIFYLWQKYFTA